MTIPTPALALEHISKRFETTQALSDATVRVYKGRVHALLGENGAGKTTLMRIAYGMESPERGVVQINGVPVRLRSPSDAMARGIGMVHQHFTLVPAMTVAENVALGHHGSFRARTAEKRVAELSRAAGLAADPQARVSELPVSAQQRVELLKALSRRINVLILDEPTAVLAPAEVDDLLRRLRDFADAGHAVVLITHKLAEALSVADDVTVLRHGTTSLTAQRGAVDEATIISAMLGQRPVAPLARRGAATGGAPAFVAHNVSVRDTRSVLRVRGANFEIRRGELVGVAGVEESGHRELLQAMAGRRPIAGGVLDIPTSVGYVPGDRHRDGLVLDMSLVENYALAGAGKRRGTVPWKDIAAATRGAMRRFDVRAEHEDVVARTLSGGNQQRLILARELDSGAAALVADNPTRGLDIRAAAYVYDQLAKACSNGVAVVLYSSDIDELISIADRALVLFSGTVQEAPVHRGEIGRAMLGVR